MRLIHAIKKYFPDTPPDAAFNMANGIYTALVHLVSIVHNMIAQMSILPEVHMKNVMQALGMPEHMYRSIKHYLDTIQKYPMYRRQTRDMMLLSTLGASVYLIHRGLCTLRPREPLHEKRKMIDKASNVLAMATANILAMEVYPAYTYYYTVCSMLLMLMKHLFVTFCHLLKVVMELPSPCREEVLVILGVRDEMLEKLKDSWLVGRIITEFDDGVDLV